MHLMALLKLKFCKTVLRCKVQKHSRLGWWMVRCLH